MSWHENDGTGQFEPEQVISTDTDGVNCVRAADLDGEGTLDVLSASSADNTIALYDNE